MRNMLPTQSIAPGCLHQQPTSATATSTTDCWKRCRYVIDRVGGRMPFHASRKTGGVHFHGQEKKRKGKVGMTLLCRTSGNKPKHYHHRGEVNSRLDDFQM